MAMHLSLLLALAHTVIGYVAIGQGVEAGWQACSTPAILTRGMLPGGQKEGQEVHAAEQQHRSEWQGLVCKCTVE
jgi:hypothetical protein